MADVKISGLPASTTPLAGTEVLPIVQAGVTKKVSIDNLTAGKAVSALSLTAGGNGTDGNLFLKRADGLTVNTEAVNATDGAIDYTTAYGRQRFYNYTGLVLDIGGTDVNKGVVIPAGNLAFGTAAKGVNFTANTPAAGMTSQLLNWYEEGTWTPTAPNMGTITYARYTRIGRQVTCWFQFAAGAGAVGDVGGLPFSQASLCSGLVSYTTETVTSPWGILTSGTTFSFRIGSTQQNLSAGKLVIGFITYFV